MAPRTLPALTKLGFRRDIRLFLSALVGFLVFLIVLLVVILQSFLQRTREVIFSNWQEIAGMSARDLSARTSADNSGILPMQLSLLQSRYGIAGVVVERSRGDEIRSGVPPTASNVQTVRRPIPNGTLVLVFDASSLRNMTEIFWATAIISFLAAGGGTLLLFLYLPRITAPIEALLDSAAEIGQRSPAVDEQHYLINTFRGAIETMKTQERELQRLYDAEKVRADDLERVTAALKRSLTSGFLAVDPGGRIVDVNGVAREILQPPPGQELAGSQLSAAFGQNEFTSALGNALRSRVSLTRAEVSIDSLNSRIIGLTTAPLFSDDEKFIGMLALFTDLTSLRRLETRVRDLQSLAELGEIAAGIAHEFRNSLSTILGYLRLTRRSELPAAAIRTVENAEREASLLAGAVDRLLAFAGPMKLQPAETDLLEMLHDVVTRARMQHPDITIACDGERTMITADAAVLSRAFENLVRNALESVQEKGSGEVRVSVRGHPFPEVRIEDTGVGVSQDKVPRLFLPFQSDKQGGYGLGLPLVRKIVLLHGGTARLIGEEGRGATAVVELPALPTPAANEIAGENVAEETGGVLARGFTPDL